MPLPAFFYQIFEHIPRQGPGCSGATRKVFSTLPPLPGNPRILDVGCGSGTQTRDLAALTDGTITAVDNHQPFLDTVAAHAASAGLSHRIRTCCASMDALPFGEGEFDLIWSEGAVFVMGFEAGLRAWKPLLKKGGSMVVSDAAWFEPNPPEELTAFWEMEGYVPKTEAELADIVKAIGFRLLGTYRLPEAGWWENYYVPLLACIDALRKTHGADPACAEILDALAHEAEIYRKYKRWYGYTFFSMQVP